jgi:hypothetical protein
MPGATNDVCEVVNVERWDDSAREFVGDQEAT